MDFPPWVIPVFLAVMLVVTTVIEQKTEGRIPNVWVLFNLVVAITVAALTGAWSTLLGGLVLFCLTFPLWRQGAVGAGLVKLSLAVGALLGPLPAAIGGASVVVVALIVAKVSSVEPKRRMVPGGMVLLLVSAIGVASGMVL